MQFLDAISLAGTRRAADKSLQSFRHAPVTIDHPDEAVNARNWKDLALGEFSTAAKKDQT